MFWRTKNKKKEQENKALVDPTKLENIVTQFNTLTLQEKEEKSWMRDQINKLQDENKELRKQLINSSNNQSKDIKEDIEKKPIKLSKTEKIIYNALQDPKVTNYEELSKKLVKDHKIKKDINYYRQYVMKIKKKGYEFEFQ